MSKKTSEKAHNEGSEFTREGSAPGSDASPISQFVEFADKTVEEVTRISKTAFTSDNASKLAAGAAVGGVAAVFLPFITIPLGALAGLGYVAYREANKSE
ncbi:MAG: hypothetical protein ABL882_02250 [Sphingopyxis sp.]